MASQPPLRRPDSHIVYLVLLGLYLALDLWDMVSMGRFVAQLWKDSRIGNAMLRSEAPLCAPLYFHVTLFIILVRSSRRQWVYHSCGAALLLLSYFSMDHFIHFFQRIHEKGHADPLDVIWGASHAALLITQCILFGYYSLGAASRSWYGLPPRSGPLWAWFWGGARSVDEPLAQANPALTQSQAPVPDCHVALMVYLIAISMTLGITAFDNWNSYFRALSQTGSAQSRWEASGYWWMAVACTMQLPLLSAVLAALGCRLRRSWVYHTISMWIAYTVGASIFRGLGYLPQLLDSRPGRGDLYEAKPTFLLLSGFFLGLIGWRYIFGTPSRHYYGQAGSRAYDPAAALRLPAWHKILLGYLGSRLILTSIWGLVAATASSSSTDISANWWEPKLLLPNLIIGFLITTLILGARQAWVYWVNTVILVLDIASIVLVIVLLAVAGSSLYLSNLTIGLIIALAAASGVLSIALSLPYILSASSRRWYGLDHSSNPMVPSF